MQTYGNVTIKSYLNKLASGSPVPGGGSAAALLGAIGAALLSKVANFTIGKKKYKIAEGEMKEIFSYSEGLRRSFKKLCFEDAKAYKKLNTVFKMPKRKNRENALEKALKEAASVPLEVCKMSYEAIKMCLPVTEKGNINLITDTGIASYAFLCAFESALLNVEINLKSIKDEKFIQNKRELLGPMEKEVNTINENVKNIVKGAMK